MAPVIDESGPVSPSATGEPQDTHHKALRINLDLEVYGTFAEIGAGQEVARWCFRVGGAAGTVAKAISAYDMTFSDAIYGPCERYVSERRLQTMLDKEYQAPARAAERPPRRVHAILRVRRHGGGEQLQAPQRPARLARHPVPGHPAR